MTEIMSDEEYQRQVNEYIWKEHNKPEETDRWIDILEMVKNGELDLERWLKGLSLKEILSKVANAVYGGENDPMPYFRLIPKELLQYLRFHGKEVEEILRKNADMYFDHSYEDDKKRWIDKIYGKTKYTHQYGYHEYSMFMELFSKMAEEENIKTQSWNAREGIKKEKNKGN